MRFNNPFLLIIASLLSTSMVHASTKTLSLDQKAGYRYQQIKSNTSGNGYGEYFIFDENLAFAAKNQGALSEFFYQAGLNYQADRFSIHGKIGVATALSRSVHSSSFSITQAAGNQDSTASSIKGRGGVNFDGEITLGWNLMTESPKQKFLYSGPSLGYGYSTQKLPKLVGSNTPFEHHHYFTLGWVLKNSLSSAWKYSAKAGVLFPFGAKSSFAAHHDHILAGIIVSSWDMSLKASGSNGFGSFVGLGLSCELTPNCSWGIESEYRYLRQNVKMKGTLSQIGNSIPLNSMKSTNISSLGKILLSLNYSF